MTEDAPLTEFDIALEHGAAHPWTEPDTTGDDCEEIAALLADAGFYAPLELIVRLDTLIDARATRRAGEGLAAILHRLPRTVPYVVLQRAILGDNGRALAEDARLTRTTKQNLHKHVQKLRQAIHGLTPDTLT